MAKKDQTKLNALATVKISDGIFTATKYHLDCTTEQTQADLEAFMKHFGASAPAARIKAMEASINKLENITPHIQLRIDAIRAIHAKVQMPPIGFTRERLLMLDHADNHWREIGILRNVIPAAQKGVKFPPGRQAGSYGPIRKAIKNLLKKNPAMKNPELWDSIKATPPRGYQLCDNRAGKYIEGPSSAEDSKYGNFCNIAWQERLKLKP